MGWNKGAIVAQACHGAPRMCRVVAAVAGLDCSRHVCAASTAVTFQFREDPFVQEYFADVDK
jgi:hypothetical protein